MVNHANRRFCLDIMFKKRELYIVANWCSGSTGRFDRPGVCSSHALALKKAEEYMEKRNQSYNAEDIFDKMDKNKLTFDYPIQRDGGQFDKAQKALLIDTVFNGYIMPDIYIIKEGTEDFSPMSVLDGKPRVVFFSL